MCTRRHIARARGRIDGEPEEVRPAVVPDRVETLPLGEQLGGIELCVEDALLVVKRPGEVGAVGRKDCAAASTDRPRSLDLGAEWEVGRVRRLALEVAWRDDVRATLARDVDKRRLPVVSVVRGRRDVDLDAGLVE